MKREPGAPGPRIEKITSKELLKDLRDKVPNPGETLLVLRRNAADYRAKSEQKNEAATAGGLEIGQLMPKSAEQARKDTVMIIDGLLETLSDEEKAEIEILVVASDSRLGSLGTPDATETDKKRAVDTAKMSLEGIAESMKNHGLDENQLLNLRRGQHRVLEISGLEDIVMKGDVRGYFEFLDAKAKETGRNKWVMYEEDTYKQERERLEVEGPQEIADRMKAYMERVAKKAAERHAKKPGKRLVVLTELPRDVFGPYANIYMSGLPAEGYEIPRMDNLGGLMWNIDQDGIATTEVEGTTYTVNLSEEGSEELSQ